MFLKLFNCYVYIVEGSDSNFYTGMTWNLRKRLRQHNGLSWGGAHYTEARRPVFLVHVEKFNSRREAHRRELEIKQMSHEEKKNLIAKTSKEDILSNI